MFMLSRHHTFLRCISLFTAMTFLPTSVQAWYFLPQVQSVVLAAEDGPIPLSPAKVAELEAGNGNTPAPLSGDKRDQLREGRVTPDAAPGNFVERYAQTNGALPGLNLAAVPPKDQSGLKTMSREELGAVASALQPERPSRNPDLPEAASVLARIAESAKVQESEEPQPVQVAQAEGDPTLPGGREVRGPLGPQAAVEALAAADTLADTGQRSEALIAYFDVMDTYGRTNEALWADQGMWNALEGLAGGSLNRASVSAFESHLLTWTPNTADGAYAAVTWDSERALAEHKGGNGESALAYATRAETRCLAFLNVHADNYLCMSAADYYQEMVNLQGWEKERSAMLALWDQALVMEHGPGRLGALYAFGSHASGVEANAAAEGIIAWSNVLKEMERPYVSELLEDATVPFWAKGFICEYAGRAHAGLGDYEASKAWYDRGVALSSHVGPTHWFLAFMSALVTSKMYPMNPETGVDAIAGYLQAYPDSDFADRAYIELGALFTLAGDYPGAAEFYSAVIQRAGKEADVALAQHELDYLLRNLYESLPHYAAKEPETPEQVAARKRAEQFCGPMALAELLRVMDIDATANDLADIAGTDASGTSMLGLVTAAEAKGVALSGVLASSPEELSLPAIAYVNRSHFVTVLAVRPNGIDIYDPDSGATKLSRSEFGSMWDGQALVTLADKSESLTVAALEQKGGDGTPATPSAYYTPYEDYVGGSGGAGFLGNDPSELAQGPNLATPVTSPGVNLSINGYETCIDMRETDLVLGVRGPLEVEFGRRFINEKGYVRNPANGRMGAGWFSNLSVYILTGPEDGSPHEIIEDLVLQDSSGTARHYTLSCEDCGGYNYYERTSTGQTSEKGIVVKAVHTTTNTNRKYYVDFPDGKQYVFSAAQAMENSRARLEYIKDAGSANTVTFLYDSTNKSTGKLTKVQSPLGDARHLIFTYDANGRITKAELKASTTVLQQVIYHYASNQLTKVTDNGGKTIEYSWGTQGGTTQYLDSITDRAGNVTNLDWYFVDDSGGAWGAYKIEVSPPAGATQVLERSVTSSVNTTTLNGGLSDLGKSVSTPLTGDASRSRYDDSYTDVSTYDRWEYKYDGDDDLTSKVDPNGTTQADFTYTDTGRVSTVSGANGGGATYEYASGSDLSPTKTVNLGREDVTLFYDGNHRITKLVIPSTGAAGYLLYYDASGQVTSVTDPKGESMTVGYSDTGRVTSKTEPAGSTTTQAYDALGNVTSSTDPDSNTTTYEYDTDSCGGCGGGSQLTKLTDPNSNDTTFAYDANGNRTSATNALNVTTALFHDDMNRITKTETPSGSGLFTTMTYDAAGRLSTQTDANGDAKTLYYDFQGNLTKETDGVATYVEYTHDALGNVSTVTDGLSHTVTNAYDGAGQLTKVTYANGKITQYFHDGYGRKTKVGAGASGTTDPTEYFFDGDGKNTKVTYTAGGNTYDAIYHFDDNGRLTKLADWIDGTDGVQYAYDEFDRLTKLTDHDGSHLDYSYDSQGRVTSMNDYHGNTTAYGYDGDGRLSIITAPGSKVWTRHYDGYGRLTKVDLPNGMHAAYAFDSLGRQTSIAHKDGGTVKQSFAYAFADDNNITTITHDDGSLWDYAYDGRKRLTKAERYDTNGTTLLHRYTYTYDAGDNLLSKAVLDNAVPSTSTTVWAYDNSNEQTSMTVDGGTAIAQAYDAWGRLTARTQGGYSAAYAYRYGDKLYSVTSDFPGEGNVTYEYGGDQKRRSRVEGATEAWYNYDMGWNLVSAEDDADGSSGALTTTNVLLSPGAEVSAILADIAGTSPSSGTPRYYTADHLGSTRGAWSSAKAAVGSYEYDPYGGGYAFSGDALGTLSASFTGKPWDATARLFHFPYRQYSPDRARWMTRDPLGMVSGPNVYAYVSGGPIIRVDPDGRVELVTLFLFGVAFTLVSTYVWFDGFAGRMIVSLRANSAVNDGREGEDMMELIEIAARTGRHPRARDFKRAASDARDLAMMAQDAPSLPGRPPTNAVEGLHEGMGILMEAYDLVMGTNFTPN